MHKKQTSGREWSKIKTKEKKEDAVNMVEVSKWDTIWFVVVFIELSML